MCSCSEERAQGLWKKTWTNARPRNKQRVQAGSMGEKKPMSAPRSRAWKHRVESQKCRECSGDASVSLRSFLLLCHAGRWLSSCVCKEKWWKLILAVLSFNPCSTGIFTGELWKQGDSAAVAKALSDIITTNNSTNGCFGWFSIP